MTQRRQKGEAGGNGGVPYFSGQSLNWDWDLCRSSCVRLLTGIGIVLSGAVYLTV